MRHHLPGCADGNWTIQPYFIIKIPDSRSPYLRDHNAYDTFNIFRHYENLLMQYTEIFFSETVLTSTHSLFWIKNKKNRYTPVNPSFTIQKWGLRGYSLHGHVFLMLQAFLERSMSSDFYLL